MKRARIILTTLFITSLITAIGTRTVLNDALHQPPKTSISASNKQSGAFQEINPDTTTANQIDLDRLAAERNAQIEPSQQVSRGYTPQKELIGEFRLTFYSPSADETDNSPFITATGARVKPGITVAVDPRYWKLGTEFYIEGYGYVIADDTGSKIKGPHTMDVCVPTKDEAFKNGIQYREVWIVKA